MNMTARNKNRLVLIVIASLFLAPLLAAIVLNAQGWHPQKTSNTGTLVDPPQDMNGTSVTLADGDKLAWSTPQRQWTLLALPGVQCAQTCRTRLDEILRMRITLGRNAERLRVLYLGPELEKDFIAARAPLLSGHAQVDTFAPMRALATDGLALALVDPNGMLILRYPEGYIAYGVRKDIVQVLH